MRSKAWYVVSLLAFFAGIAPTAQAQPTLLNPSFELPVLIPGTSMLQPGGTGWLFSSGAVGIASDGNQNAGYSPTVDGTQSAYLSGSTSIQQNVGGFSVGQNYQLEWLQNRRQQGSGGVAFQVVLDKGLATESVIAPYEVAGAPDWLTRSSDVFTATKSSYTVTMEALDIVQDGYASRISDLDRVAFVTTSAAPTERLHGSATLSVAPSDYTLQLFLGGVALEPSLTGQFAGSLSTQFDYVQGLGLRNIAFQPSALNALADVSTTLDFGPLGSIDLTLDDAGFVPYTAADGSLQQRLTVHPDGTFNLQSWFMTFLGNATYDGHGPLGDLLGDGSIDLTTIAAADLGYTSTQAGDIIFPGPGTINLSPTGNPLEYLMTVDAPIVVNAVLDSSLDLELLLTSHIHATGLVTLIPEPATVWLAASAMLTLATVAWCRRRKSARL
jgi:hypothetical protein